MDIRQAVQAVMRVFPHVPKWLVEETLGHLYEGLILDDTLWTQLYFQYDVAVSDGPLLTLSGPLDSPLTYRFRSLTCDKTLCVTMPTVGSFVVS